MRTITVGTAHSQGPGVSKGILEVGYLPDGMPIEIPVIIVQGATSGPVVWMHACVHGNEYCGTYCIHSLIRSLDVATVSGTVVALPVLNITGFQRNQRMSPFDGYDGGDLNRFFPGDGKGSLTAQMAEAIWAPLREYADYHIDMHTALTPDTRWALFSPPDGQTGSQAEGMARAFGYTNTLPAPLSILGGSSLIEAAKVGIPGLLVEAGGVGPGFLPETVADVAQRLRNVLRHLGMLPGEVVQYEAMTFFSDFAWVTAKRGGLWRASVVCGETVERGQLVGRFYDLFGDLIEEALTPEPGVILAVAAGPTMPTGEIIVHVGLNPRPAL